MCSGTSHAVIQNLHEKVEAGLRATSKLNCAGSAVSNAEVYLSGLDMRGARCKLDLFNVCLHEINV